MVQVLTVSRNEDLREMLSVYLSTQALRVASAASVHEACAVLKRNAPRVVIWDAAPGMESCLHLNEASGRKLEYILLTSSLAPGRHAEELGCSLFLEKPFDPTQLLDMLRRKLNVAQLPGAHNTDSMQMWISEVKRDFKPVRTTWTQSSQQDTSSETVRFEVHPWPRKI